MFEYDRVPSLTRNERTIYVNNLPSGTPEEVGPVFSAESLARNPSNTSASSTRVSASEQLSTFAVTIEGVSGSEPGIDYLWPEDTTVENTGPLYSKRGFTSLYEYRDTGNSTPALVGVDGEGRLIGECGVSLAFPTEGLFDKTTYEDAYNALSADGSRLFFTVAGANQGPSHDACTAEGVGYAPPADELFARTFNSEIGQYETTAISEPPKKYCSACDTTEPADAVFQGASRDGSKVLFLLRQRLLGGTAGEEGENLYEYNFDAEQGDQVTLIAPKVVGVARLSEDGSRVYFVSEDNLSSGSNPIGSLPEAGADNLYCSEVGHTAFVGVLSPADSADWQREDFRPFAATPDGRFAVFDSHADLKHEGTRGLSQVFEYGAPSDGSPATLVRASVGGMGETYGAKIIGQNFMVPISTPSQGNIPPQLSMISDSGSLVVFESQDALVPQAEGSVGFRNVYEYHSGIVSLISDGQDISENGTTLLGVDGSGTDIFFTSADRLVPQDGDTQVDVYDARVDGCQGGLMTSPMLPAITSMSQPSGENVVADPTSSSSVQRASRGKSRVKKSSGRRKSRRRRGGRRLKKGELRLHR
jgi:hypothetical protein